MARTKKSETLPNEDKDIVLTGVPDDSGDGDANADAIDTDVSQDLSELMAPAENEDAPLLLPDTADEGDAPSIDNDVPSAEDDTLDSDWHPEDMPAGTDESDAEEDAVSELPAESGENAASDAVFNGGDDTLWGAEHGNLIPSEAAETTETTALPAKKNATRARKPATESHRPAAPAQVLTIERRDEVETAAAREELLWHEIQNARRTRRILTGTLGGIERLENGKSVAVVYYKELRVIIPTTEMMLRLGGENPGYGSMAERENKILGNMLGCDIDFVIKGIDSKSHSAVASRREAMLRKRKNFFVDTDAATGVPRVHEGRIVQARVIAVAAKIVRVEVFGVESSIMARDLSWDWIGDAHERFTVGDKILIRVNKIRMESIEELSIQADARSMTANTVEENLKKCRVQGRYAGTVTDIHKGVVFIRLSIGVNAIAHSCLDSRMPAKRDEVSFVVTHIDKEQGVAMGLITRIIKQRI